MEDPLHLFQRLLPYMDRHASDNRFSRLVQFTNNVLLICPTCHTRFADFERTTTNSCLQIYPCSEELVSISRHLELEDLIESSMRVHTGLKRSCLNPGCSATLGDKSARSYLLSPGPILCLNAVWCIDEAGKICHPGARYSSAGTVNFVRSFSIPMSLATQIGASSSAASQRYQEWRLSGIVCRRGDEVDAGHYVAIVMQAGRWWVVDDVKVDPTTSPSEEAFALGQYPVAIFYERVGQAESSPKIQADLIKSKCKA